MSASPTTRQAMQFITYTRVSTQEQGHSRNGLEGQDRAIQAFILSGGHEVLGRYTDVASGKLDVSMRPQLRAALLEVKRTGATLLVSKLDRLSRSVQFISRLMDERIRFATVEDGLTVEPMMLHMKAVFAEQERKAISERTKAGLASTRARGTKLGFSGKTYEQAQAVRAAGRAVQAEQARAYALGMSLAIRPLLVSMTYAQVADHLNTLGIKTSRDGTWHASTVSNVLKRASS